MRTQHIQNIREKCIEANPDILKLEFGCKIAFEVEPQFHKGIYRINEDEYIVTDSDCDAKILGEFEIIGRDIRLADVLMAMIYKNEYTMPNIERLLINWILPKDNLEDQSDETLEFISNLLQ